MANVTAVLRSAIRNCSSIISRSMTNYSAALNEDLSSLDLTQVQLLNESCILVDNNDKAIGAKSKLDCHLMENINKGMVHRAFSVFLFNTKQELLIQQRSDAKITFPGCFTNTCCSHPLHNPSEMEEENAIGVKRAAQRRLQIELGIDQLKLADLDYLTRIQYAAPSNGKWGESEVDYILVAIKDVQIAPNENEVKNSIYIAKDDFQDFLTSLQKEGQKVTPWFQLIANSMLSKIWENLHDLTPLKNHKTITKM